MKKYERVVTKLLSYYKEPQNFSKTITEACQELGLPYHGTIKCIEKYGRLRFHTELFQIRSQILSELSAKAVGKLIERLENPKNDREFWTTQTHLREWHKTLVGTVQRIEQKLEGKIEHEHNVYIEFLKEARERLRKLSSMASEPEPS